MPFSDLQPGIKKAIDDSSHVVIKLGTGLLTSQFEQGLKDRFFSELASQLKKIITSKKKVIIVSSGAVGLGKKYIDFENRQPSLQEKQALASLGQGLLIDSYRKALGKVGLPAAQILVSKEDFSKRKHYRNLKNTIDQLLQWNCIPIINENDAVAVDELKYGDNDLISALVSSMYQAAFLILLTNIDGFYADGKRIELLSEITDEHLKHLKKPSAGGSGGMRSKLVTAGNLLKAGQLMNISSGADIKVLSKLLSAKNHGTWIYKPNSGSALAARKRWLLHHNQAQGRLVVDPGAGRALTGTSASLLAVGITEVRGNFRAGEVVDIIDNKGNLVARGITSFKDSEIKEFISSPGKSRSKKIVHRDNLVLLN